jgi:hypothetical protein
MANDDRNILERRGRPELSKYWPDGTRFRRPFPNVTQARQMRARIEAAIATGTWRELKAELSLEKKPLPPQRTHPAGICADISRRNAAQKSQA